MDWNRRDVLKGASALVAGIAGGGLAAGSAVEAEPPDGHSASDTMVAGSASAIVETASGKVAGYIRNGFSHSRAFRMGTRRKARTASCLLRLPNPGRG